MQPERYKLDSPKYNLDGVSLEQGAVYTLPRDYDIAHVVVGEVSYDGQAYGDKKTWKTLLAGTTIGFTVPSIVLLGYAK